MQLYNRANSKGNGLAMNPFGVKSPRLLQWCKWLPPEAYPAAWDLSEAAKWRWGWWFRAEQNQIALLENSKIVWCDILCHPKGSIRVVKMVAFIFDSPISPVPGSPAMAGRTSVSWDAWHHLHTDQIYLPHATNRWNIHNFWSTFVRCISYWNMTRFRCDRFDTSQAVTSAQRGNWWMWPSLRFQTRNWRPRVQHQAMDVDVDGLIGSHLRGPVEADLVDFLVLECWDMILSLVEGCNVISQRSRRFRDLFKLFWTRKDGKVLTSQKLLLNTPSPNFLLACLYGPLYVVYRQSEKE